MVGSTRYGVAGTYIADDDFVVNTISASIVDNGYIKAIKTEKMESRATTKTVVCNYSGVLGKHSIISPTHGAWSSTT